MPKLTFLGRARQTSSGIFAKPTPPMKITNAAFSLLGLVGGSGEARGMGAGGGAFFLRRFWTACFTSAMMVSGLGDLALGASILVMEIMGGGGFFSAFLGGSAKNVVSV